MLDSSNNFGYILCTVDYWGYILYNVIVKRKLKLQTNAVLSIDPKNNQKAKYEKENHFYD